MTEEIRILKATTIIFILTLITKALQIIFFPLVAAFFGTSGDLESFIVALSIPTLIISVLFSGFGTVFIPIFIEQKLEHGEKSAWEFASSLINVVILATIVITIIGIVSSPWLIHFIVPGMESAYKYIGVKLTQLLFVTVILLTSTIIFTAILQSYQSFIFPAWVTLISNLVLVATLLIVKQKMGIYVLATAYILSGATSAALLLIISIRLLGRGYKFKMDFKRPAIKAAMLMFTGIFLIGILNQMIMMANRFFASFLPTGSIATLEYASRAVFLIIELLTLSVVAPLYQRMSSEAAMDDKAKFRGTFLLGMKMTAVALFPAATFLVFLRIPIFSLLLEHGKFMSQNTLEVSSVFLYLSMAIVGGGFGQIVVGAYYAIKMVRLLLFLSFCGVMLNIILSAVLVRFMEVNGLGLATGIASVLGSFFALKVLSKKIGGLDGIYLTKFMLKTIFAAILSGILGWLLFIYIGSHIKESLLSQAIKLGASAIICAGTYILLMSLFRINEINFVLSIVKERFKAAKTNSSGQEN